MLHAAKTTIALAAVLSATLIGQEPRRTRLDPAPIKPTNVASEQLRIPDPIDCPPTQRFQLDDEPDFAPTEDILDKDGNVIEVRQVGNPYVLAFTNGSYTPAKGIDPELRRTLRTKDYTYGFVMIRGRMSAEKMTRLKAAGLRLLGAHTFQSVKARIPAHALPALEAMPFVHWVGYARQTQKIDHNLVPVLANAGVGELLRVIVNPFESDLCKDSKIVIEGKRLAHPEWKTVDAEEAAGQKVIPNGRCHKLLEALGFVFEHYNEIIHNFECRATKAQILALLNEDWVHSIETKSLFTDDHDQALPMVRQDRVRRSYSGKGVPCGFIDSGLDSTPWHSDFGGKAFVAWGSAYTPLSDHGTHVAGTIWGRGSANDDYKGAAPDAGTGGATNRIFISRNDRGLSSNASSFGANYKDSRGNVSPYPRVISNSYSSKSSSGYTGTESDARTIDTASYNKRQLWVFSSGNRKSTSNMWCGSPSSAKNVLTVGSLMDVFNSARTVNQGQRSGFSRWGVLDSRTKPEVCAPGDVTTSCNWNSTTGYVNKSGTSMSTPLVSGCLISKVQTSTWYRDKPEILKAFAVASAKNGNTLSGGTWAQPQSGKGSRQTTGHGMINAYNMIWSSSDMGYWVLGGTFTASGQAISPVTITLPSNVTQIRLVLCYTEKAASGSATKARLNDVRAALDYESFTGNSKTGDRYVYSGIHNVIVYNTSVPTTSKGKKAQLKVWSQSITSNAARWGLVVFAYRKNTSVTPVVSATGPTYVKPSTAYKLTGTMSAPSTGTQFMAGRLWYSGSFTMRQMWRVTEDSIGHIYSSTNTHMSSPFPSVGVGPGTGMVVGSGSSRSVDFFMDSPSSGGWYNLMVQGTYDTATSPAPQLSATKRVCVDGSNPNKISGLTSTSHTVNGWSNDKTIDFKWNTPTDVGCSGVYGLAYHIDTSSSTSPFSVDALGAPTKTTQTASADSSTGYYFHLRARDNVGYYGVVNRIGPFKIDTVKPVITTARLKTATSSTYTSSLTAVTTEVVVARDVSGVDKIRYQSGIGSSYTAWMPFSSNRVLNLVTLGANTLQGTKTVSFQVMDRAGNISATKNAQIIYVRAPRILSITASNPNLTKGYYKLTGTGFTGAGYGNLVIAYLGGAGVQRMWTSANEDDWWIGRIRIVSDGVMYLYPPQNRVPGTYTVQVRNFLGVLSNTVSTKVEAYTGTGQHVLTQDAVTAGKNQYLLAALGTHPAGTTQITMISLTQKPSVIPGLVSMGIGNNWTDYFLLPNLGFSTITKNSVVGGKVPLKAKGATAYFQTAYFRPGVFPALVSTIRSTTYK